MDFLEFVRNNEIEIRNNRIYKRYYLDNSYADPDCYVYEIQDTHNMVGFDQKFWVKEYGRITDYILVIDYNVVGDIFGYKVKKGFEEKEVGFLYRIYGSSGEYYKFQPSFEEKPIMQETPVTYSSSSSSSSSYGVDSTVWGVGFIRFILPFVAFFQVLYYLRNHVSYDDKDDFVVSFWLGVGFGLVFALAGILTTSLNGVSIAIILSVAAWGFCNILNVIIGIIWKVK
ncbi:MAG: hypothetical protein K2G44_01135 [Clostridia bacterium]|nr:hypothetical protein [Clostridia bacterium]